MRVTVTQGDKAEYSLVARGSGSTWLPALHVHAIGPRGRALSSPSLRFLICEMGHNGTHSMQHRGLCGSKEALARS